MTVTPNTPPLSPLTTPPRGDDDPFSRTAQTHLHAEVSTQPDDWMAAADIAREHSDLLPGSGERVMVLGCGSSQYVAHAIAGLRERTGQGLTDAWPGGDALLERDYDHVLAISRSGTTTEILTALESLQERRRNGLRITVITADTDTPIVELGDVLSLAAVDEQSVVQSRTATTAIATLRWHLGEDLARAADEARAVLAEPASTYDEARNADQISFVGMGWTFGVAEEAGLKLKESTQSWTDAYQMTEFRHGPISISSPGRIVWAFGPLVPDFARDVASTGATLLGGEIDPLAELVRVHRLCLLRAGDRGLDPDQPRGLARSIILDQ